MPLRLVIAVAGYFKWQKMANDVANDGGEVS